MKGNILLLFTLVLTISACSDNKSEHEAEMMLDHAGLLFHQGDFDSAKATIDSLRTKYPQAIEARKKAIVLKQNIDLQQIQADLVLTDSALQSVQIHYEYLKKKVLVAENIGNATAENLSELTRTRIKRDSLRVRFDVDCAKIKFIHKRQKEN